MTLSSRYYLIRESKLTKNEIDSYQIKFDKVSISNQWEEGKLYEIGKKLKIILVLKYNRSEKIITMLYQENWNQNSVLCC